MTREEAIDIIKCLAWHRRPPEEDVEMAIQALEQEPCEDDTDTNVGNIDKVDTGFYIAQICAYFAIQKRKYGNKVYDELYDHACKLQDFLESNLSTAESCTITESSTGDCISRQAVLEIAKNYGAVMTQIEVEKLSSVQPERKKGRWEWVQYDADPNIGNYHCSECRFIPAIFSNHLKFCPYCGAKMEVSDADSD